MEHQKRINNKRCPPNAFWATQLIQQACSFAMYNTLENAFNKGCT